jgi:radical SAM superfamily enzyme YgiQ (UPF0313 family)
MRILLTHGFFLSEDPIERQVMKPYPPLGLLYISAYIEQLNLDHELFDSTFRSPDDLKAVLQEKKPECIGIYANFLTRNSILRIIQFIREHKDLEHMNIILGGPDVRYHAEDYLAKGADYVIVGEGEVSFYELIQALQIKTDLEQIDGLIYRNERGEIIQNRDRAHLKDLDLLPFPNRQKIDLNPYLETWKKKHGYSSITISTQRGCPFTCNWCSHAVYGDTYRRRSPGSVVKEIKWLTETYNPDAFWFVDDVFTMSERWIDQFAEELDRHHLSIQYECITRADKLNEDLILKLKNTGCRTLWIGAESGSQKVIDLMDRRVEVIQVREMIQIAKKHRIETGTFIMLGYPGEKMEDIRETIRHLKISDPDTFTINLAYPIKGTRLYETVRNDLIQDYPWAETPDRDVDFHRTYRRIFYDFAIRKIYNEVYAHQNLKRKKYFNFLRHRMKSLLAGLLMQISR